MIPRLVTGLGIVGRAGIGREAFFETLDKTAFSPPLMPIESFDAGKYTEPRVYEVPDFDPKKYLGDKGLRTLDRLTKIMVVAARLALHDAGLKKDGAFVAPVRAERAGLSVSNAYGTLEAATELNRVAQLEDARYINPAKFPNTVANSASGYVSIWEDLRAVNVTVSDGNCGALDAVAVADVHMGSGRADVILVGGAEAMSEALFLAFLRLGVLKSATIGEGGALMALETQEAAKARGATALAEVIGYGTSFMAPDDERLIHASSDAMERAIKGALDDAGLKASDIDIVASGISGLPEFDTAEGSAIRSVLGGDVAVATPKRLFGDTLGASGAMGMACALAWFAGKPPWTVKPPTRLNHVLVTTLGFYGNASALVMRRTT